MKIIGYQQCEEFLNNILKGYQKEKRISTFEHEGKNYTIKFDSSPPPFNKYYIPNFDGDILMLIGKPKNRKHARKSILKINENKISIITLLLIDVINNPVRLFGHLVTSIPKNTDLYSPFMMGTNEEIICITNENLTLKDINQIKEVLCKKK